MITALKRLFVDHPREVGEGYFEHMGAASLYGLRLGRLMVIAFTHAIAPGLFRTTVSDEIRRMAGELGHRAEEAQDGRMREAGVWDPGL